MVQILSCVWHVRILFAFAAFLRHCSHQSYFRQLFVLPWLLLAGAREFVAGTMLSSSAVPHFAAAAAQPRLHSLLGPVPSTSHVSPLPVQRRVMMAASSNGSGAIATADASTSAEHAARLYELVRDMGE